MSVISTQVRPLYPKRTHYTSGIVSKKCNFHISAPHGFVTQSCFYPTYDRNCVNLSNANSGQQSVMDLGMVVEPTLGSGPYQCLGIY